MKNHESTKKFFKIKKNELCGFVTELQGKHWWQLFPVSRGKYPFVIEIPEGITAIKENAFTGLKAGINGSILVKIPTGVTRIEKNAFSGCEINKLFISDTVTYIDPDAFRLSKIGEIEVDKANLEFKSEAGSLYNYDLTAILRYAGEDSDYTVLNTVTTIGKRAFENTSKLECIYIPDNVTVIADGAFYNSAVKSISGAAFVTALGQHVFALCRNLRSFMMPNGVTNVNHRRFYCCDALESITLSQSTAQIGEEAFYLCTSLREIELPNDVKSIGKGAFEGCRALRTVKLPERLTSIGERTFKGCASFSDPTINDSIISIGKEAFSGCNRMKKIVIGVGVTSIGEHAFLGCSKNLQVVLKGRKKEEKLPFDKKWKNISSGSIIKKKIKNIAYLSV